jgi:hypothetical protein
LTTKISLHGLGFIQVELNPAQRLHVWHPDLPRRKCFEHSQIHTHSFDFQSTVLVGEMLNHKYYEGRLGSQADVTDRPYTAYRHEGARTVYGNRPWIRQEHTVWLSAHVFTHKVGTGLWYRQRGADMHSTQPLGDGRVATLMTKTATELEPAFSLVEQGIVPDVDFDRHQLRAYVLWEYVVEVLARTGRFHAEDLGPDL